VYDASTDTLGRDYSGYGQSEMVMYNIYGDECMSDPIHFCFLTKNGTWDTYTFDRKNVRKLTRSDKTYAQGGIRDGAIFNPFSYTPRKIVYDRQTTELVTCQSNWMDANDTPIVEDLFNSTQVFIIKDFDYGRTGAGLDPVSTQPYLIPIRITDTNFEEYTGRYNKLFQYTLNFEYNPFQMYRVNL
jgi:hypothetical protein